MRSSSHPGSKTREPDCAQTKHQKCHRRHCPDTLYIIGVGPGDYAHLTLRAHDVLKSVETVVGYTTYIDLIRSLIDGKEIIATSMKKEVDRVGAALEKVLSGKSCAIVSSGDAGVYAMAGLVFEMCQKKHIAIAPLKSDDIASDANQSIHLEVIPGIPALCSGAALLGAPLTHDFAAISLSDLLTPWDVIEKRIEAAAMADFVIVFYNPRSKKRDWQLGRACEIISNYRADATPVGIVKNAMRDEQQVSITTLSNLNCSKVDMLTTVFVGNSTTFEFLGHMVTPRGYSQKYTMTE